MAVISVFYLKRVIDGKLFASFLSMRACWYVTDAAIANAGRVLSFIFTFVFLFSVRRGKVTADSLIHFANIWIAISKVNHSNHFNSVLNNASDEEGERWFALIWFIKFFFPNSRLNNHEIKAFCRHSRHYGNIRLCKRVFSSV